MSHIFVPAAARGSRRLLEPAFTTAAVLLMTLGVTACIGPETESGLTTAPPAAPAPRQVPGADPAAARIDHSVVEALPADPSETDPANSCGC